jgi:hypothetical protein
MKEVDPNSDYNLAIYITIPVIIFILGLILRYAELNFLK